MATFRPSSGRDLRELAQQVAQSHGAPLAVVRPSLTALAMPAPSRQDLDTAGFERLVLENDWSGV